MSLDALRSKEHDEELIERAESLFKQDARRDLRSISVWVPAGWETQKGPG
jgi:hypothetical protein